MTSDGEHPSLSAGDAARGGKAKNKNGH
jgi:hypothetical protein